MNELVCYVCEKKNIRREGDSVWPRSRRRSPWFTNAWIGLGIIPRERRLGTLLSKTLSFFSLNVHKRDGVTFYTTSIMVLDKSNEVHLESKRFVIQEKEWDKRVWSRLKWRERSTRLSWNSSVLQLFLVCRVSRLKRGSKFSSQLDLFFNTWFTPFTVQQKTTLKCLLFDMYYFVIIPYHVVSY